MADLIFPKTNEGKEDPAILSARKTLINKKQPARIEEEQPAHKGRGGYRGRKPRCYLCGEEFEKSQLKSAYSTVLKRQGNYCSVCMDKRNDAGMYQYFSDRQPVVVDAVVKNYPVAKVDHYPGRKDDSSKLQMNLLPWDALEEVAKVLTVGAKKYAPDNWRIVPDAVERYESALVRHLAAYKKGEDLDPEDGLSHLAHLACNALFLVSFRESGK